LKIIFKDEVQYKGFRIRFKNKFQGKYLTLWISGILNIMV